MNMMKIFPIYFYSNFADDSSFRTKMIRLSHDDFI